jgi:prevent-host-death family protein
MTMNDSPRVGATELRHNLAALLDEVRSGTEYTILRGNRPTARLLPPLPEERNNDDGE